MKIKNWLNRLVGSPRGIRPVLIADGPARKRAELERDIALAGVHDEHPVWLAVLSLVDDHAARETEAALSPRLNNEERQYAAGCAATANYLSQYLRDARRLAAERMNRERRQTE